MPTTLDISAHLALDAREQVADVIALEKPVTQRLEDLATLRVGARPIRRGVPSCAEHLQLRFVLDALALDRFPRPLEAQLPLVVEPTRRLQLAYFVELLVQGEDFLEQRRRHLP